jgi:hypothetical protein
MVLEIRNIRDTALTVIFEPWADSLVLQYDEVIQVEAQTPQLAMWQVEYGNDLMIVYGMSGSTMRALRDGVVLWECFQALPP